MYTDSAGGTVGVGRDKDYQALFRLRGKILNTFDMELYQARKNKEVDDLVNILRCGHGKDFDISKLRFDKIIFLADADDDGTILPSINSFNCLGTLTV